MRRVSTSPPAGKESFSHLMPASLGLHEQLAGGEATIQRTVCEVNGSGSPGPPGIVCRGLLHQLTQWTIFGQPALETFVKLMALDQKAVFMYWDDHSMSVTFDPSAIKR